MTCHCHRKASRCTVSSRAHRYPWPKQRASVVTSFLLFVALPLSSLPASCRAEPVSLTDKTFDSVREAFNRPSMLILAHASGDGDRPKSSLARRRGGDGRDALEEFGKLSDDRLLREGDILPVAVDAPANRMLAARMGVSMDELPSLVLLHGDRVFRYRGGPTSAGAMRSYALQGYLNQGAGEAMPDASYRLLVKVKYFDWLFDADGDAGNFKLTILLFSGFVGGLSLCGLFALVVSIRHEEGGVARTGNKGKNKRKKQ